MQKKRDTQERAHARSCDRECVHSIVLTERKEVQKLLLSCIALLPNLLVAAQARHFRPKDCCGNQKYELPERAGGEGEGGGGWKKGLRGEGERA